MSDPAEGTNPIDPVTAALIRRKAAQLAWCAGPGAADRDDIEQDLTIEVLTRLPDFDPERAGRDAFVRMVLAHAAADWLRRWNRRPVPVPVAPTDTVPDPRAVDPADAAAVAEILAGLPEDLRAVTNLMPTETVAAIARALGISRSTAHRRVRELRARFEQAGFGNPLGIRGTLFERTG